MGEIFSPFSGAVYLVLSQRYPFGSGNDTRRGFDRACDPTKQNNTGIFLELVSKTRFSLGFVVFGCHFRFAKNFKISLKSGFETASND